MRRTTHADLQRVRQVLAGLPFPAEKWQLIMYAEEYGADATTRSDLWALPVGSYPDLSAVLRSLGMAATTVDPARRGHRAASPATPPAASAARGLLRR